MWLMSKELASTLQCLAMSQQWLTFFEQDHVLGLDKWGNQYTPSLEILNRWASVYLLRKFRSFETLESNILEILRSSLKYVQGDISGFSMVCYFVVLLLFPLLSWLGPHHCVSTFSRHCWELPRLVQCPVDWGCTVLPTLASLMFWWHTQSDHWAAWISLLNEEENVYHSYVISC